MLKKNKTTVSRCAWVNLENSLYIDYHDFEWGREVHDDIKHFEMLTLEGAQAGLSWETILNKRANYRQCFANFDPHKVAKFSQAKVEKILQNPGIVRNRLKVESTISNAKSFLKIQQEFGSFDRYIWSFVNHQPIDNLHQIAKGNITQSTISDILSKDLKKRGFRFVGSTIIYALMQAIGLVNDHHPECYVRAEKAPMWSVYMVCCKGGELYTGITNNVQRRIQEHSAQGVKCAKYLRGKAPLTLVYQQCIGSKSQALKVELTIKKYSKEKKKQLIKNGLYVA